MRRYWYIFNKSNSHFNLTSFFDKKFVYNFKLSLQFDELFWLTLFDNTIIKAEKLYLESQNIDLRSVQLWCWFETKRQSWLLTGLIDLPRWCKPVVVLRLDFNFLQEFPPRAITAWRGQLMVKSDLMFSALQMFKWWTTDWEDQGEPAKVDHAIFSLLLLATATATSRQLLTATESSRTRNFQISRGL